MGSRRATALRVLLQVLLAASIASATQIEHLQSYSLAFATPLAEYQRHQSDDQQEWVVTTTERSYHVVIQRNRDLFSTDYKHWALRDGMLVEKHSSPDLGTLRRHCHFRGVVKDEENSRVALSLCDGVVHGEIVVQGSTIFIEPHSKHFDAENTTALRQDCLDFPSYSTQECSQHHDYLKSIHAFEALSLENRVQVHITYSHENLGPEPAKATCGVQDHVEHDHQEHEQDHHMHGMSTDFSLLERGLGTTQMRAMYIEDVKYVELFVVNDIARFGVHGSDTETHAESIINIVNDRYLNAYFDPEVRIILVGQLTIDNSNSDDPWAESPYSRVQCTDDPTEVDHTTLLDNFLDWSSASITESYDNIHLLSHLDFCDGTVGYAPVGAMCYSSRSGGISQVTYADQQSSTIVAHELGHNFNMLHDGTSNECDPSSFVMASSSCLSCSSYLDSFSSCSKEYFENLMYYRPTSTSCLDNVPTTRWGETHCGDGFVEEGEECDCGSSDCSLLDPCCNGATCMLNEGAECSNLDACCSSCRIVPASDELVCRDSFDDECDVTEVCDGNSASCPDNIYLAPGESCVSTEGYSGLCYHGGCVSHDIQCLGTFTTTESSCSTVSCGSSLTCTVSGQCRSFEALYGDGTPCSCGFGVTADNCQCFDGECVDSIELHYTWETSCELSCETSEVVQEIRCRKYDGEFVADSFCDHILDIKPEYATSCSSFAPIICDIELNPSGDVSLGDTISITWTAVGTVDYVSILLDPEDFVWPAYIDVATSNTGVYNWTIAPPITTGLHTVGLVVSSSSSKASEGNITILDNCADTVCVNGECDYGICVCDTGFTGDNCSTTLCEAQGTACMNGGTCDGTDAGTCTCPVGYSGSFCQIDSTCTLDCGTTAEPNTNCTACICLDNYVTSGEATESETGADCSVCGLSCGTAGTLVECSSCECIDYVTGDSCEYAFIEVTFSFALLTSSDFSSFEEIGRFAALIDHELLNLLSIENADLVVTDSTSFSYDPLAITTTIYAENVNFDGLVEIATTIENEIADVNSVLYRSYALRNVESVSIVGELPEDGIDDLLNWLLDWFQNNLEIVVPIGAVVLLLIIYKIRSDSVDQNQKDRLAGVQEGRKHGRQEHRNHHKKHRDRRHKGKHRKHRKGHDKHRKGHDKHRERHENKELIHKDNKGKKKRKHKHKKNKRDHPVEEQDILAAEFGAQIRTGLDDGEPIHALAGDDPMAEGLPPNWSVQYYDDGTAFYFNALLNIRQDNRPQ